MDTRGGSVWNFCVRNVGATQVYLAIDCENHRGGVTPMQRVAPGIWRLSLAVPARGWSFCYYVETAAGAGRQIVYRPGCGAEPQGIYSDQACCACRNVSVPEVDYDDARFLDAPAIAGAETAFFS